MKEHRPYSMVKIPSKGLYYPNKKDRFFVRLLTYEEEYILTDDSIMHEGDGLKHVLESVIIDDFDVNLLVPGDVQAISLFLRSSGYGDKISLDVTCPSCGFKQEKDVLLSNLNMKQVDTLPDEGVYFNIQLPDSKKRIKLRVPTFVEEVNAEQKGQKGFVSKLQRIVIQINDIQDKRVIAGLCPKMSMKDARYLKDFLKKNTPGVDTSIPYTCDNCAHEFTQSFNTGHNFLKLPGSYRENMMEQLFNISYHSKGGITWSEAIKMPTLERIWMMRRINKAIQEENKQIQKTKNRKGGKR